MRIGLDATPLLGARTGVGRYVAELVRHLPEVLDGSDELVATAFTLRGAGGLSGTLPSGVSARNRRLPARLLQELWARTSVPPVGLLSGRVDLFHGTNFVLPPPGRAAGVVTVHDVSYLRLPEYVSAASRRYTDLVPRSVHRAAAVCVPSAAVAAEVGDAYPAAAGKVMVTPLGVTPEWATSRPPSADWLRSIGVNREYLLFVGTLEPRKDLATAVRAYRLLYARGERDLPLLVLAGPAGWGDALDVSGLPEQLVVRLGPQPDDSLRRLMAGAAALLYPSLYEGFGLPVLEAFACGIPILASAIPTTLEVLGSARALAGLYPAGDAEALAELIAARGADPADAPERRRAHARAYTWERTAQATVEAYRRVLA